jgi:hypothetical protein
MHRKFMTCALAWIAIVAGCAQGEDTPAADAGAQGGAAGTAGAAGKGGATDGGAGSAGASEGGSAGTGGSAACTPNQDASCHVVVNEVMTASTTSASDEFVEVYNPCATKFQLPGWRLVYRAASGTSDVVLFKFTAGSIDACEYLVIGGTEWSGAQPYGTFVSGGLSAEGGGVALNDGTNIVDSMGWGSATNTFVEGSAPPGPAEDMSLGRSPNAQDTNDNEGDFKLYDTPSPGAANP